MTFLNDEDKPSLDELSHFGVLGMKWGRKRQKAGPTQIRAARRDVDAQAKAFRTNAKKLRAMPHGSKQRAAAEKSLAAQKITYLKNPNRVIAVRMTRGEKLAGVFLGAPLVGFPGFTAIAATSAVSRRIERKQDLGKFDAPVR